MLRSKRMLSTLCLATFLACALAAPQPASALRGDCSQPVSTGQSPIASDCLFILRTAVQLSMCDPACICDPSGSGSITASDALLCLQFAVGGDVELMCPCETTTTSSTTITTSTTTTTSSTLPPTTSTTTMGETTTTVPTTTTTIIIITTTTEPPTTTTEGPTTTTMGPTTTTTMGGGALCPDSGQLQIIAGVRGACDTNADCMPGVCDNDLGRCRTGTELDTGFTGIGHDADITDDVFISAGLSCPGEAPDCGVCDITGLSAEFRNCRCANDNQAICDEPFVADADDCGGNVCNCYIGPPLALSAGNTFVCVVNRFAQDVSGTADVDEGDAATQIRLRSVVFLGVTNVEPCPYCAGKCTAPAENLDAPCRANEHCDSSEGAGDGACALDTPLDGNRDGVCVFGDDQGTACDADGFNQSFPAYPPPGGGHHSIDCFPTVGQNISGQGLRINFDQTTDATSLTANIDCGFPPFFFTECHCSLCTGDNSIPCSSNADCVPQPAAGNCALVGQGVPLPHSCDTECLDQGGGEGLCDLETSEEQGCDGIVRADGSLFLNCTSDEECTEGVIGVPAGACTLSKRKSCFLNTIEADGVADPTFPVGAAIFCIAQTTSGGINSAAGLPGPGRVFSQGIATTFCGDQVYTPGVGCSP